MRHLEELAANAVAVHLYGSLGYRPAYPFWFRVKARQG